MDTPFAIAVIPARYESSRFPGKPLACKTGKPLIQHVAERVRLARRIDQVIVATDDQRIFDAVVGFGCQVMMTREDHVNGTSRIAEVVAALPKNSNHSPSVIVNVQGDEPLIEPTLIDDLVESMLNRNEENSAPMATVASAFSSHEDPLDPNIVKVVIRGNQNQHKALYFSRALIPFDCQKSDHKTLANPLKHVGIYAYRPDFLLKYVTLPPTPLEQTERLEQLRALEHGYDIAVVISNTQHHGIDTPEQYEAFVRNYKP